MKGKVVQLKHEHLFNGNQHIHVGKISNNKIERAKRDERGVRLQLNSDEIQETGGKIKWKDVSKGLVKGLKFLNKSKILQPLIETAGTAVGTAFTGNPVESALISTRLANASSSVIGKGVPSIVQDYEKPARAKRAVKKEQNIKDIVNYLSNETRGDGLYASTANGLYGSTAKGLTLTCGRGKSKKTIVL